MGTIDTGLSLKEQVKRGDITAKRALGILRSRTKKGKRGKTYLWLKRRVYADTYTNGNRRL